jgi:hypothetical protein
LLTYSILHSPSWEANRFSASQKIPHILWTPKVCYHSYKCLPPVPILSQLAPVQTPTIAAVLVIIYPDYKMYFYFEGISFGKNLLYLQNARCTQIFTLYFPVIELVL